MRALATAFVVLTAACPLPVLAQAVSIGDARFDFADEALRPKTADEKALVSAYLAAAASGKPEAVRALVHPASTACSPSGTDSDHLAELHARDAARNIPPTAKIIIVRSTEAQSLMPGVNELMTMPVQPTAYLGIDYSAEVRDEKGVLIRHRGTTILRMLAPADGRLAIVEFCLTDKGKQLYREKRAKQATTGASEPGK